MREISELIIELLKTHSRVSLPGLGAFVAAPQPAIIDKASKSIAPPSKRITFSKAETWNDGLLEQLYAERHDVNLDEARDRLRLIIVDIRFELDATGKLALPGLGTLKQSQARDINFGLDKSLNLKTDSYGLGDVRIEPGASAFKVRREESFSSPATAGNNLPQLILFGVMLVAISALLLYLFLNHHHSKDDPANPQQLSEQAAPTEEAAPLQEPQRIVHTPQQPAKPQPATPKSQPQPAAAPSSRCEYCVIATSLSTYDGAVHKANSYKQMGYKSEVIHSGSNRYRVALGCYRDGEAAKQELRKTQKFITDAWVLEVCR